MDRQASETAPVVLAAGALRLMLNPSIGGSISAFEWLEDDQLLPILRKCHSASQNVLDAASFPLVPYVNRIRRGRFAFRGCEVRLAPNMSGDPSPLHGQGWLNPWTVVTASEQLALLIFDHRAGEWPWDYEARQEFKLDATGLSLGLSCRNVSNGPMPCGLGQHPYFPCGPETQLDTRVTHAWTIDEHVLPIERVVADGHYDLRERRVCGQDLDNGFDGWNGEATMTDPNWPYTITMSSLQARLFQLYSPKDGANFVAEPVTHANAAINAPEEQWSDLGIRVLEPGEEMRLDMRLEVIASRPTAG